MKFLTILFGPLLAVLVWLLAAGLIAGAFLGWVGFPLLLHFIFGLGGVIAFILGEVVYLLWLGFFVAIIDRKFSA